MRGNRSGKWVEGTPTTIETNQGALDALAAEITALESSATPESWSPTNSGDDEALLQKAAAASNGGKFRALFYQGSAGYPSASEADMALCLLLAFWTGRDPERMDRLFRKSALYREKWDTARSQSTYGQDTIHKAAALCRVVYDPERPRHQLERDIEQLLGQAAEQHIRLHANGKRKAYRLAPKDVAISKVLAYLDENEYGDARFFADVFAGQVCYDHTEKEWYLWNEHHWKRDTTSIVRQLVAGVLGTLYLKAAADLNTEQAELDLKIEAARRQKEDTEQIAALTARSKALTGQMAALRSRASGLRSAKRNANVLRFIETEMGITAEQWDTNPWLLAVPNGVLDLQSGTCRDGMPDDYIRTVCPTEWTGLDTPCPRFEQFLQEVFEDKPDRETLIAFLHRLLGYCITGLTLHHLFPILFGEEGRNGKDTLLAILKTVLGALVGAVSNDVFIAQDKCVPAGLRPRICATCKASVWSGALRLRRATGSTSPKLSSSPEAATSQRGSCTGTSTPLPRRTSCC
jgi:putative DNA primase/helicase